MCYVTDFIRVNVLHFKCNGFYLGAFRRIKKYPLKNSLYRNITISNYILPLPSKLFYTHRKLEGSISEKSESDPDRFEHKI